MGRPEKIGIERLLKHQLEDLETKQFQFNNRATFDNKDLIYMLIMNNHAVFTEDNSVDVITDGRDKFQRLLSDISKAKDHIHLQYYIYKGDELGKNCGTLSSKRRKKVFRSECFMMNSGPER